MTTRRVVLILLFTVAACVSGGGSALYQREIGNASGLDAVDRARLVITRHHYEIADQDSIPFIRIETHWRPRTPFADEQALGVTEAESRLIVVARARSETQIGRVYNVRMTVENRVRVAGAPDWNQAINTDLFEDYADEIVADFRTELSNIGVRRYGDPCCDAAPRPDRR